MAPDRTSLQHPMAGAPQDATSMRQFQGATELVAEARPALVRFFLRRCDNREEAEDLAQDVLLSVLSGRRWASPEHARRYIFRAAANRWLDRQRRAVTRGISVAWDDEDSPCGEELTPERVSMAGQELECLASALAELSERTRDVFMLVRLERMKQGVVAEMLGISVSAVEKHLVKALAHLMRRSRREEGA